MRRNLHPFTQSILTAIMTPPEVTTMPITKATVPTYLVTLSTPGGPAELEVPTLLGPEAAGRRAWAVGCQQRWGDVDQITVSSVELLP